MMYKKYIVAKLGHFSTTCTYILTPEADQLGITVILRAVSHGELQWLVVSVENLNVVLAVTLYSRLLGQSTTAVLKGREDSGRNLIIVCKEAAIPIQTLVWRRRKRIVSFFSLLFFVFSLIFVY